MRYLIILLAFNASAQTIYSNQYGQPIGSSTTVGNTTYYSNQYGQPVGTATQPAPTLPPPTFQSPPVVAPVPPVMPLMPIMPLMPMLGATR